MNVAYLIKHPEALNLKTIYELRKLIATYPYYQPARLLLLKNLYLLHDPTFEQELKNSSIFFTNRSILFDTFESVYYQNEKSKTIIEDNKKDENLTDSLIDNYLDQVPEDSSIDKNDNTRKPNSVDATIDYVAYLLETENSESQKQTPELKGQSLIDDFINKEGKKITLSEDTTDELADNPHEETIETEYFTETLARIYIKQQRYSKALEIIKKLNLEYPKKNSYFASQIRFLEKLVINSNNKK